MAAVQPIYVAVFSLAAVACFASVWRASRITDRDTRVGIVSLLLCCGVWAAAIVGRMAVTDMRLKITFYMVGLVVGLASVGAWLYFCSAYAGYGYHRERRIRQVALVVFLSITALKLTNPWHSLYFTYEISGSPFPHLTITLSEIHWVVTGMAYSLSAVGFYLLYELFRESRFETTKLGVLVSLTAAPAVVDVVAFTRAAPQFILPFNYEPIGVGLFAIGVLYVVDETFVAVPRRWRTAFVEQFEDPIVLLTDDGRIRDFNREAGDRFPEVADAFGQPLATVSPELYTAVEDPERIIEVSQTGETQFYTVQRTPLSRGTESAGQVLAYKDVTDIERKRRELRRQNDQLNEFSVALNHELRNAITVLQGVIDQSSDSMANTTGDFDGPEDRRAKNAVNRMQRVISDLTMLAQYGQTPETKRDCELRATAAAAWDNGDFDGMAYTIATEATITANHPRLEELLHAAFEFAHANGATAVTVDVTEDTLRITGDGEPLDPSVVEDALEFGPTGPRGDAEMSLPNIRLLARVQGWTTDIDTSYTDGVRICIGGVTVRSDDMAQTP